MLGCWIARLHCRLCTVDDCRGSLKTHSLQNKNNKSISISMHQTITPFTCSHFSSFKTGCNLWVEMIVIDVRPVKQVIYFFFISLKLCNTEQYRMWHWRRLFPVPFMDINPFFFLQYIPKQSNKYRVVINSFMHTFLICCNKSCSLSWRSFNISSLKALWSKLWCFLQQKYLGACQWALLLVQHVSFFYEIIKARFYMELVRNGFALTVFCACH